MSADKPLSFGEGFGVGFLIGFFLMGFGLAYFVGVPLPSAQADYTRCITDGAPKERCLENYLLPKNAP